MYDYVAGPAQSVALVDRRGLTLHHSAAISRRSPRPSDSTDTVHSTAAGGRTYRKSGAPISAEPRLHGCATPAASLFTSTASSAAAAVAATGRADRPPRPAHQPGAADQSAAAARSASPGTAAPSAPRSNRSSELRMARRDFIASSKPSGQLITDELHQL